MNQEIAVRDPGALAPATAAEVKARVQRVQEIMASVMIEGTHYGSITDRGKKTLFKAGSETLLMAFGIACKPQVEDLGTGDEIRYRVLAIGEHIASGAIVGQGVGEASSSEEKYRWRAAVCDEEFDETPPDRRRIKYGWRWGERRGEKVTEKIKQVRTVPADLANTVLKMAKKRAQVDMTLTALAVSDIFEQDLEDDPDVGGTRDTGDDPRKIKPRTEAPRATDAGASSPSSSAKAGEAIPSTETAARDPKQREFVEEYDRAQANEARSGDTVFATGKQIGLVKARCAEANLPVATLLMEFGLESLEDLAKRDVDRALAWIKEGRK
jgi:hypothetical protein